MEARNPLDTHAHQGAAPAPGGVEAPDLRLVEAAGQLVADLDALISDSKGVAGLHLNGDVAEWDDLQRGGRFESWLSSLDTLRDLLDKLAQAPAKGSPQDGETLDMEAIEERVNAAQPGPWDPCWSFEGATDNDFIFATYAREDVPALIREVRRLRSALAKAEGKLA